MSEAALDLALRDLGAHLAWPEEAELATRVSGEIENVVPLEPRRSGRRVALVAAAALLVLTALLAVSPGLRAAILELLGIRGAEVEVQESASPPPSPAFTEGGLGAPVTRAEAEEALGFEMAVPASLGEAEGIYLLRQGSTTIATAAYMEADLILSQFRGSVDRGSISKTVDVGQAEYVEVNGELGIWIEGPHTVLVQDASGSVEPVSPLRSGNTLLWTLDGVTLRLEGAPSIEAALRIARTVAL